MIHKIKEEIVWTLTEDDMPDEGITVLVFVPEGTVPGVWYGYLDEGEWRVDNGDILDDEVVAWAEVPAGPIAKNKKG